MPKRKGSARTEKATQARRGPAAQAVTAAFVDGEINELLTSLVLSNACLRERCFNLCCELGDKQATVVDIERILINCVECEEGC